MPTYICRWGKHSWQESRRGSLEEALYAVPPAEHAWSVSLLVDPATTPPTERMLASDKIGIDREHVPHPSLLARQIIATLHLWAGVRQRIIDPQDAYAGSTCTVEIGIDDPTAPNGERWDPLPPSPERQTSASTALPRPPRIRPRKLDLSRVRFELEESSTAARTAQVVGAEATDRLATITVHHAGGRAKIFRWLLELRPVTSGLWDLVILNTNTAGEALTTAKGVYLSGLDSDLYLIASCLGIATKAERDVNAIPATWRPGTFEIMDDTEGKEGGDGSMRRPVLGFVRGPIKGGSIYGLDRRSVEMTYGAGTSYEWKREELRWHLTHINTGLLILDTKRRKSAEQVADRLLSEVPELNEIREKEEMTSGLQETAKRVIEMVKSTPGWDR